MDYDEYRELYSSLKTAKDVERLSGEYDDRLLDTLFTQKTSREVKKNFYRVKQNSKRMLNEWSKGKSIVSLADKYRFPPILVAMFIFLEDGASKKEFWSYINDPNLLESEETANEVREAVKNDIVYSPEANNRQKERGIWGENLLHEWLDGQGVGYRTENDLRGTESTKTPDCLLDYPVMYKGHKICWVESKASFGDNIEFRFNSRKQLVPYTQLFGPGLVVYWVGCLDDLECPEGVYVSDISVMDVKLNKWEE
ncbi:MAG: C15orf41 family protein [Candidatus Methanomethylophilaceae archaeon]|nr:C15orf41 family protein [Candidatus Methanomethylophilaceae archaeon]MBR3477416.1 C15orf41 family protein [Candidatus Methanomethylophilaceae archaeon]MBR4182140.1 C15orf41 family protein [Candidatus Methanomethylophilaceae archaeon]